MRDQPIARNASSSDERLFTLNFTNIHHSLSLNSHSEKQIFLNVLLAYTSVHPPSMLHLRWLDREQEAIKQHRSEIPRVAVPGARSLKKGRGA
jgi:hypothetical protein